VELTIAMRQSRRACWPIIILAALVGLPLIYYNFILDWDNKPYCHKQIDFAFQAWMDKNGQDSRSGRAEFPNIGGVSADSLHPITQIVVGGDWPARYGYIPGLRQSDPGHLVLMYVNRPTRWTMHVTLPPTIFEDKAWILVPVDFCFYGNGGSRQLSGPGESSERVSTDEFKRRLAETIEFIRSQKRPNWETIVAEQTKFLNSIDSLSR
jgi:hypothetical protein